MESELKTRIDALEAKYAVSGQALLDYLDGLVETDYLKYWDYIHLDTLLSLQSPRTKHHDEPIFIMYHQITELYFKLCLHELKDVIESEGMDATLMEERLRRCDTSNQERSASSHRPAQPPYETTSPLQHNPE